MSMSARRQGRPRRRQLEFEVVRDAVRRDKARFIARLEGCVKAVGECQLWTKSACPSGYGRTTLWSERLKKNVSIHAHRLFLILKLGRPIRVGYEAGHEAGCVDSLCVRHVEEQHWQENLKQQARGNDVPF